MRKGHCLLLPALALCFVALCIADDASSGLKPLNETDAERLKRHLLAHYDRTLRPSQHYNVTNVDLKLTITHVDIDEESSIFSVYGWIGMTWTDQKMVWNPADYGNLSLFRTHPDSVWRPDLVLYNNAKGSDNLHYGKTNILVYNVGKVLWVPPTDYHGFCELNLRLWPFDYQTCFLKIGSWTYDGYKLNLTAETAPETIVSVPNNEWTILKVTSERHTVFYSCCAEPYIDIQYNVTLQRQSSTHKAIVVSPAFVIILLALSVFWLPPNCGEKIFMNGIIILIVTIFLIYFAQQLPAMSGNTPLIVTFFSTTLYLVALSTLVSITVLRLTRSRATHPVPGSVRRQLDGCLGSVLGVNASFGIPSDEEKEVAGSECVGDSKHRDWCRLALLIDRLAFVIFLVIYIICIICYSV